MSKIFHNKNFNESILPKTYFDLIRKVGSNGKYQNKTFLIFIFNCFISSLLLMSTSFIFLNPKINCNGLNLQGIDCQTFFCQLPQNRQQKYLEIQLNSLAVQFGPFYCQKKGIINLLKMSLYIGAMFGYFFNPFIADNYGRKFSMIISWVITLLGIVVLSSSFNIDMASLGLFFAGFGCESGIRTMMVIMSEILQDKNRQNKSAVFSISFGLGSLFIGLIFYFIKDWRQFTIIFCLIPGIIQMILLILYLEETPKYLLKKDIKLAVQDLNRIAQINGLQADTITQEDVKNVINENVIEDEIRTPLALWKYESQRWNSILLSLIFFSLTVLYYGPLIIISKLHMNIYVSQFALGTSQILAYFACFLFIDKSPRKLSGYKLLGLSTVCFLALVFFTPPQNCQNCLSSMFQLMIVFLARFFVCFFMATFFIYITEFFPLPLRGTGFGFVSFWGAVASSSSQFILTTLTDKKHNPMMLFAILSATTLIYLYPLRETFGKDLQQNIPEEQKIQKTSKLKQTQKIISE